MMEDSLFFVRWNDYNKFCICTLPAFKKLARNEIYTHFMENKNRTLNKIYSFLHKNKIKIEQILLYLY